MLDNIEASLQATTDPVSWHSPMTPMTMICLIILMLGLPLICLLARSLPLLSVCFTRVTQPASSQSTHHITPRRTTLASLWRDDRATATIEFTMVFPILLFLIMLLTQSTLLMGGRLVVNQAAFHAARSAVVVIPTNESLRYESWNTLSGTGDSYKIERIRQAAVMAVLPIAGRLASDSTGSTNPQLLVNGLTSYYNAYNRQPPQWINTLLPDRLRYANANTSVEVLRTRVINESLVLDPITAPHTFGPRDPITVRVTHRMNLAVPYVGMIFASGRHTGSQGSGLYTNIVGQCTLTNEGIVNALPPTPSLRRIP